MSRPPYLSTEAIREMVARYAEPSITQADLARQFKVSRQMVSQIMSGRRFSNITGITPLHSRDCKNCKSRDIRAENVDLARTEPVEVFCHICHGKTTKPVGVVLNSRGAVRCSNCDGRRG